MTCRRQHQSLAGGAARIDERDPVNDHRAGRLQGANAQRLEFHSAVEVE